MKLRHLTFALALVGCSLIPGTVAHREQQSRERLAGALYDAESARFRNVTAARSGSESILCGEVNAKNKLGAYAGFHRFVVSIDAQFAAVSPDQGEPASDEAKAYQAGFDSAWEACEPEKRPT